MSCVAVLLAAACCAAAPRAAAVELHVEPLQASVLCLDALYTETAGVDSRAAARLGLGVSAGRGPWSLALAAGRATTHTDFGLLDGPRVRLERADTQVLLRYRLPLPGSGFSFEPAAGLGRLTLRYHPDRIAIAAGGQSLDVALEATHAWTRHVAAELLHGLHGRAWISLGIGWTFYTLDVATPMGTTRRDLHDWQAGVGLRVRLH